MRRVAIYVRISKDREGAGHGIERQREDCEQLADSLGWSVVNTFSDNDLSAYGRKRRPGYEAMCAAVESGRIEGIVAWHADRLHRRLDELERFMILCDSRKVAIRTVRSGEMDLATPSGRMLARMLGAAARHEVEHNIERQRRAKEQAAHEGKYRGGRRCFGFEADGMNLREPEAEAIRDAVSRLLSGASLRSIATDWNEVRNLRTSYAGNRFTSRECKRVLTNPRLASKVLHEGKILGDGRWPAIIDGDTHAALVALLTDPVRGAHISYERKFQGSGVYVCGICGERMLSASQVGARNAGRRKTYRCSGGAHLGRIADQLDAYVDAVVLEYLSRADVRLRLVGDDIDLADRLRAQLSGANTQLAELTDMFTAQEINGDQLKRGSESLRRRVAEIEGQLRDIRARSHLAELVLSGDDLEERWEATTADIRGKIIDTIVRVTLLPAGRGRQPGGGYFDPTKVTFDWKV